MPPPLELPEPLAAPELLEGPELLAPLELLELLGPELLGLLEVPEVPELLEPTVLLVCPAEAPVVALAVVGDEELAPPQAARTRVPAQHAALRSATRSLSKGGIQ